MIYSCLLYRFSQKHRQIFSVLKINELQVLIVKRNYLKIRTFKHRQERLPMIFSVSMIEFLKIRVAPKLSQIKLRHSPDFKGKCSEKPGLSCTLTLFFHSDDIWSVLSNYYITVIFIWETLYVYIARLAIRSLKPKKL